MRVDPDNSAPTRSTSAPSQGVARGDAKRRKIASSDHSGIGAIQSADMPAQPPVSKKGSKRSRPDDESSDVDPRPTKRSHHDVTLAPRPTNKQPSKRRRSESSDDESSDAGLRPTKKIQMEDVHAEAEEAKNPTVDRITPLGAELPPVQELSVHFSAHCTSRKFNKRSLPTNFLTETEEEVDLIRIGSSLGPVEEEECEEEQAGPQVAWLA